VQWNIVIARDYDFRKRDRIQKLARLQEFFGACALCQITGHRNEIWFRDPDKID
jgi:hypothetical protein